MDTNEYRESFKRDLAAALGEPVVTEPTSEAPAPPVEEAPAETPPVPVEEPTLEVGGKKVFGKFQPDDIAGSEKSYFHMLNYTTRTLEDNRRLKEQLAQLQTSQPGSAAAVTPQVPGGLPGSAPRVNPVQRNGLDWMKEPAVVKLSEKTGIEASDLAEFAEAVTQLNTQAAEQTIRDYLIPMQQAAAAEQEFTRRYPDLAPFMPEMALFFETKMDADAQEDVRALIGAGRHVRAMGMVAEAFKASMQTDAKNQLQDKVKQSEAERQVTKAQAAVTSTTPGTPIHAADPSQMPEDPALLQQLIERARAGDYTAHDEYRRRTIGRVIEQQMRVQPQ